MSKAKPLMFGAALGASAMFFAQQYHVVQSQKGLQVIPRTPQQSIGLAYADIRTWSPSQWTDRPELARALMAHGSADLISDSVASSLADRVSEETSTLDELRGFLNRSEKGAANGDGNLLSFPSLDGKAQSDGLPESDINEGPDDDLFRIPFPQDAKVRPLADPFAARPPEKTQALAADTGSRFSANDLAADVQPADFLEETAKAPQPLPKASSGTTRTAADHAREMEELIWGKPSSSPQGSKAPKPVVKPAEPDSMFEEVTTQLENRAQEMLNRAQVTLKDKAVSAAENSASSSSSYVRDRAAEMVPDSAKSLLNEVKPKLEKAAAAPLLDFDPFLE